MIVLRIAGLATLLGIGSAGIVWFGWGVMANMLAVRAAKALPEGEPGKESAETRG